MQTTLPQVPLEFQPAVRRALRSFFPRAEWRRVERDLEEETFLEREPSLNVHAILAGGGRWLAFRHYCSQCELFGPVVPCSSIKNPELNAAWIQDFVWFLEHLHE
jgi:hypothetical protein